ncbi:unnamed protein product, partial [Mesorhabditis spiculigera]
MTLSVDSDLNMQNTNLRAFSRPLQLSRCVKDVYKEPAVSLSMAILPKNGNTSFRMFSSCWIVGPRYQTRPLVYLKPAKLQSAGCQPAVEKMYPGVRPHYHSPGADTDSGRRNRQVASEDVVLEMDRKARALHDLKGDRSLKPARYYNRPGASRLSSKMFPGVRPDYDSTKANTDSGRRN